MVVAHELLDEGHKGVLLFLGDVLDEGQQHLRIELGAVLVGQPGELPHEPPLGEGVDQVFEQLLAVEDVDCQLLEDVGAVQHDGAVADEAEGEVAGVLEDPELDELVEEQVPLAHQQQPAEHHLELEGHLDAELVHLPDALEDEVGKALPLVLLELGLDRVEDVGVDVGGRNALLDARLVLGADCRDVVVEHVLPEAGQRGHLQREQVVAQPPQDYHLGVAPPDQEQEQVALLAQVVEDDLQVEHPLADAPTGVHQPPVQERALVDGLRVDALAPQGHGRGHCLRRIPLGVEHERDLVEAEVRQQQVVVHAEGHEAVAGQLDVEVDLDDLVLQQRVDLQLALHHVVEQQRRLLVQLHQLDVVLLVLRLGEQVLVLGGALDPELGLFAVGVFGLLYQEVHGALLLRVQVVVVEVQHQRDALVVVLGPLVVEVEDVDGAALGLVAAGQHLGPALEPAARDLHADLLCFLQQLPVLVDSEEADVGGLHDDEVEGAPHRVQPVEVQHRRTLVLGGLDDALAARLEPVHDHAPVDQHVGHDFELVVVGELLDGAPDPEVHLEVVLVQDVQLLVAVYQEQIPPLAEEDLARRPQLSPDRLPHRRLVHVPDSQQAVLVRLLHTIYNPRYSTPTHTQHDYHQLPSKHGSNQIIFKILIKRKLLFQGKSETIWD